MLLDDDDPPYRRLMMALHNPALLKAAYDQAHVRADKLRKQLRALELEISQAQPLVYRTGQSLWPPLRAPVRPPTLHEAMRLVFEARGNRAMHTPELAREIARRCLYRRRDGLPASTKDISARASAYPQIFERPGRTGQIRLRGQPVIIEPGE